MAFNFKRVESFLNKHKTENILIFGFTFIIWKHFIIELEKLEKKSGPFKSNFIAWRWVEATRKSIC